MDRLGEYLKLAEEEDRLADDTVDPQIRSAWRCIAESYRELVKLKAGHSGASRLSKLL